MGYSLGVPRKEPRIRVAMSQMLLHAAAGLPAADHSAIRSRLSPETLAAVQHNLALAFIPMSFHMELSDAVRDVVGSERAVALWETTMHAAWDRPFLRGFVSTVTTLLGLEPQSLLKQVGHLHEHLTHDLADVRYLASEEAGRCTIAMSGFPSRQFRFICYVEGLQGCLQSVFPLTRTQGLVVPVDVDENAGDVAYRVSWSPRMP